MDQARVHCTVYGQVQGVYFRAATQEQARFLGVAGWVRNRRDGTVELVAEGERVVLQQLVDWCHQGPPTAQVTWVETYWEAHEGDLEGFAVC